MEDTGGLLKVDMVMLCDGRPEAKMASFSLGYVTSVLLCSSEGKPCAVSIVALTVLCGGFLYGLLYFDLEVPKYKPQAPECSDFCRNRP